MKPISANAYNEHPYLAEVRALRESHVSTPEICAQTGLAQEEVLKLLLLASQPQAKNKEVRIDKKRSVGRPRFEWERVVDDAIYILGQDPSVLGLSDLLWTTDNFLSVLKSHHGRLIAKTTLCRLICEFRYSHRTLLDSLRVNPDIRADARRLADKCRGNLYVLVEIHGQKLLNVDSHISGLLAVRSDNYITALFSEQRNITSKFYLSFLQRLLEHHDRRHVVVLYKRGGKDRESRLSHFALRQRRLHLVSLR
jgi:hypothetical protein